MTTTTAMVVVGAGMMVVAGARQVCQRTSASWWGFVETIVWRLYQGSTLTG